MISFIMETVPADAAFLAIAGRYYVRRCKGLDPEESLQDGATGPASFARATGALLLRCSYWLTCKLERVALYLLRPDAGLVVPAPTPTPTWLGDAIRAGCAS